MVADDHLDVGPRSPLARGLEQGFETVGFLRDEDGDGLGLAVRREPDLDVDVELVPELGQVLAEFLLRRHHLGGVDVHGHPEDALPDGLV